MLDLDCYFLKTCLFIHSFILLFEKQCDRDKDTGRERKLPFAASPPKCLQQPGLGQTKARSQDLSLYFPHGGRNLSLGRHFLPPRDFGRELGQKQASQDS